MTPDTIEFIPPSPQQNVLKKLNELIEKSIEIKGLICYWTIPHKTLHDSFAHKITAKGFIAIDVHEPTNIDSLIPLVEIGSNIFLHLYKATGTSEHPGTQKIPPHLMHSKIFFFKANNHQAIIWIGSHNATNRALQGHNIESSVLIRTALDSDFCQSVEHFLEAVRAKCEKMDLSLIDYYKWLQGHSSDRKIIELLDPNNFAEEGFKFVLFITKTTDAKGLKTIDHEILVSITKNNGDEIFFSATIGQLGKIKEYPDLKFSIQYYAHRKERRIPSIAIDTNSQIDEIQQHSEYFAVFTLTQKQPGHKNSQRFVDTTKDRWKQVEDFDIFFPELTPDTKPNKRNHITIKKAAPSSEFRQLQRNSLKRLDDKSRPLVTKVTEIAMDDGAIY